MLPPHRSKPDQRVFVMAASRSGFEAFVDTTLIPPDYMVSSLDRYEALDKVLGSVRW